MAFSPTVYRTYFVADVTCYHCQHQIGTIRQEIGVPNSPVLFRPTGGKEFQPIARVGSLRCTRCGGPTYLDEAQTVREAEEPGLFEDERPRKGRPIKIPPHLRKAG
jgi:hypothetical protein